MTTTSPPRRPDESMSLLTSITEGSLDPGYDAAAQRHEATEGARTGGMRTPLLVAFALLIGLMLSTSAVALRGNQSSLAKTRAELVSQITAQQAVSDRRLDQIRDLQAQIAAAQQTVLTTQDSTKASELASLGFDSGAVAVTGPGIVLTLDDAPAPDPAAASQSRGKAQTDDGRVLARDLQIVTNSLWEAGAEAMSVNSQRLTSKSAIRFAGDAILVNFRPLARPYVIQAIGDPKRMPADFAAGSGGSYLRSLQDNFHIRVTSAENEKLVLPAATSLLLQWAEIPRQASTGTRAPASTSSAPDRTESSS